jgi:hypothetical protein
VSPAHLHTAPKVGELRDPEAGQKVGQAVVVSELSMLEVDNRFSRLSGENRTREAISAESVTSAPPPLVVMILFPLNDTTPTSPKLPAGRSPYCAPRASAASSKIGTSWGAQISVSRS